MTIVVSPSLLVTVVGIVGEHLEHEVAVLRQGGEVDAEVVLEPLAEQQRLVLDRISRSRDQLSTNHSSPGGCPARPPWSP